MYVYLNKFNINLLKKKELLFYNISGEIAGLNH